MTAEEFSKAVALFGGAANFALPDRMRDVSDFRPVPDHQEVFTDASVDQSVIIDILVRSRKRYAVKLVSARTLGV
jgi:Ran-interacting Mog1 protein